MKRSVRIRMDDANCKVLNEFSKGEKSSLSETLPSLISRGRVLLAVEKYKSGNVSLGKAAKLAGLRIGKIMEVLTDFRIENRMELADYLQSLDKLKRVW